MSRRPPSPQLSRKARARREAWKRAGVWAFLVVFALSVVGFTVGGIVK